MSTIKKNIATFTTKLDSQSLSEFKTINKRYQKVRSYVFNNLSSINYFLKIYNHRKEIRDVWTKNGMLDKFNLPKRFVRMALDDCIMFFYAF